MLSTNFPSFLPWTFFNFFFKTQLSWTYFKTQDNMASVATLKMPVDVDAAPMSSGLMDDPFFLAMESGRIHWGDLMAMSSTKITTDLKDDRVVEWWTNEYKAAERLSDWDVPDLTLRSDIEEHFPVVLMPLSATEDGRERFVVKFDDRVDEWAATRAESHDEYLEYADWVQTRLIFALHQYTHKYRIESEGGEGSDHVVIFAMAHPSAAARRARAAIPTLRGFPVSWDRDPADHTRHLIKLHQKRMSEEHHDPSKLAEDMVDALIECKDCTFEPAETGSSYLMIVTIPTAEPPAAAPAAPRVAPRPAAAPLAAPVAAPLAAAPRVAMTAMGGAGGPSAARSALPRAIDVMRANRLAWDRDRRDGRIHRIKHRGREQESRILAELSRCGDCTVEPTPRDSEYMCVLTLH